MLPFFFSFHLLVTIISMYCMQSRFEKNCATLRKVCASAKSFAEELSRPPYPRACYPARGHVAVTSGQQTKPTRYTARLTYQAHAQFSAATAKPFALYSAASEPSSRAIQRGDGQAIRAVQRGKRTKLTRYTARRRPSHSRCTARQANQAHALYSAATTKTNRAVQRGERRKLTR